MSQAGLSSWETSGLLSGEKARTEEESEGAASSRLSKHEKLLLNTPCVCAYPCAQAQICVHWGVCVCLHTCTCSPSQTPQAPQSPTAEAQEGACTGPSAQLRSTTQSRLCLLAPAQSPPTSQARSPSSARHARSLPTG